MTCKYTDVRGYCKKGDDCSCASEQDDTLVPDPDEAPREAVLPQVGSFN